VDEKNWIKWMGEDAYRVHAQRMRTTKDQIKFRIVVEEGDKNFIASDFAEYRWISEEYFSDQSFYSYAGKLALIRFTQDDVYISIINDSEITRDYRALFDIAWETVAQKVD
jgi:hypothetical protein